ncbi:hypothetical protein D9756_009592 [Leucocoprinus leucothites]|uniref:F-box domain-containing protein n=1 Tax=Leucocoprinus leucothites TaxID=201217 RepID=A0A8H5CW66_9AGAR|nr:hypothetical protein D9756_009592 [Leucoagaricus leucothites]
MITLDSTMPPLSQKPGWIDLPVEIIERIVACLDNKSLLNLGKVNRISNRVALARLLGHHVTSEIMTSSSITIPRFPPTELMSAISAAVWLPPISHIDYSSIRYDVKTLMGELHGILRLISASPPNSLKSLRLRFLLFDRREPGRCLIKIRRQSLIRKAWLRLVSRLVDTALHKGCKVLDIGGSLFPYPPMTNRMSWLTVNLARFFEVVAQRVLRSSAASATRASQLDSLIVGGHEPIHSAFLTYTLQICKRSSGTLQHLEFWFPWLSSSIGTAREWANLFDSLSLPHLRTLSIAGGVRFPLPPSVFAKFLHRHPHITDLKLKFSFSNPDSYTFSPRHTVLPNLRTLQAWPRVLIWLLSPPASIEHGKSGNAWYPSLTSVTILPSILHLSTEELSTLTRAILLLNHLPHTLLEAQPLHLTLEMCLLSTCWIKWIEENAGHSALGEVALEHDLTRSRIKNMTLLLDHSVHPDRILAPELPTHLGRWVAIFPMLEELEISPHPFISNAANERLKSEIQRRCPMLKVLKL